MMRRVLWYATLAGSLSGIPIATVSAPTTPDPLVCPAQTTYRRIELKEQGAFAENCRDQQGLRQGPYRFRRLSDDSIEAQGTYVNNKQHGPETLYNSARELLSTTSFLQGSAGEVKFTRAGLVAVSKEANEYLRQSRKQVFAYPSGNAGLTFEHTVDIPSPGPLSPEAAQRFRQAFSPLVCGLLARQPGLQSIDLRIFWSGGQIAAVEKFRLTQCGTPISYPGLSAREP